jgi:hypothetical protein
MICPETNELAIARRILGMADRLGNSAIPEEIANEAKNAMFDLTGVGEVNEVRLRAISLCMRLQDYYTKPADGTACRALKTATENLRAAIAFEALSIEGREAA